MAKKSKSGSFASIGCGILFLLPFAGVGTFMIGLISWTLIQWAQVSHWVEGKAIIQEVKVKYGDGTTGVDAVYTYEWENEVYEGDKVSLQGGMDNIGKFQDKLARQLTESHKKQTPVPCYINPRKPTKSILNRELRWEMIAFFSVFAELFGMIGIGGIVVMVLSRHEVVDEDELKEHHPEEPWKWKREWLEGVIPSSSGSSNTAASIFIATYWNIVALPLWVLAPLNLFRGNGYAAIALLIPLIGVLFVIWAIRVCIQRSKFGLSTLRLVKSPGVIGGRLEGALMIDHDLYPDEGFEFKLRCEEVIRRNKSSETDTLYEDSQIVGYENAIEINQQMAVPISFYIPYECKDTDDEGSRTIGWELQVKAKMPGVDYSEKFEVPVFKTPESQSDRVEESEHEEMMENLADPDAPLTIADLYLDQDEYGTLYVKASMGRNFGAALGLGIFSAIWLVAVYFMYQVSGELFLSLFGFIGMLCFYGAVNVFFQRSDVQIDSHSLECRVGGLFFRKKINVPISEIEGFSYKSRMRSGNNSYYHIYLDKVTGKSMVVFRYVNSEAACRRLISILQEWV